MSDMKDFVIENGVLKKYVGPGGDVVIPDGVTSVGNAAFSKCHNLSNVTLPDSVTSIGDWAFYCCSSLTSVTIGDSVTSLGRDAFYGTGYYNDSSNWINDVLYIGEYLIKAKSSISGDLEIRPGTKSIGKYAFADCSRLTSVTIPVGVTEIGEYAFDDCSRLERAVLPDSVIKIGDSAFFNCSNLQEMTMPVTADFCDLFGYAAKTVIVHTTLHQDREMRFVASFRFIGNHGEYPKNYLFPTDAYAIRYYDKLVISGRYDGFAMNEAGRIRAAIWRLCDGVFPVEDEVCDGFSAFLESKINKAIKIAEEDHAPDYIKTLVQIGAIHAENIKRVNNLLFKSADPDINSLAGNLTLPVLKQLSGADAEISKRLNKINAAGVLLKCGIASLPQVLLNNGEKAPEEYLKLIIAEYAGQAKKRIASFVPLADETAEKLDRSSLQTALFETYSNIKDEGQQLSVLLALFRYCESPVVHKIFPHINAAKWKRATASKALLLSDTRAAMIYADKLGLLSIYAEMRKMDEDTLRDQFLSDVGLDEHRGKTYDLGNQIVTARLQKDFTFLFELPNGKTAKSLPKKGADEEKYAAAKADFDEIKKSVKKIIKNRFARLFEDFLSGRSRDAAGWQASYLHNPLLRDAASLLVWIQGNNTFTLTDDEAINSAGQPYTFRNEPITVAHPLDMQADDLTAWQKYFTSHGLKQPFAQVWEPVHKAEDIKPGRYKDCMIPYYRFKGQEKHGIGVYDNDFHNWIEISFKDCDVKVERIDLRRHDIEPDDRFEVQEFTFKKYTRQVNHIVAYLDRVTVWDRVRKDDLTVGDMLDSFTFAQIMEFISVAQEANATNVLALLLNYKNEHFADYDPMDVFVLE